MVGNGVGSSDLIAIPEALTWLSIPPSANRELRPEFFELVEFISSRVEMLNPDQVARCGDALIAVLEKRYDGFEFGGDILNFTQGRRHHQGTQLAALNCLIALAPRLNPEQVTRCWDGLIGVLDDHILDDSFAAGMVNSLIALAPRLSSEHVTRSWDSLNVVLEDPKYYSSINTHAVVKGFGLLASRLSPEQLQRGADALIVAFGKTTNKDVLEAAPSSLVALAPKLSPEQRVRIGEAMVASLRVQHTRITEALLMLMPHLEPATQSRLANEALVFLFDHIALAPSYFASDGNSLDAFRAVIMAMNNPQSLARLLQHPACIGKPREWMLQRFEELVFHDGNRVFLNLPEEDGERQGVSPPSEILAPTAIPAAGSNEHGGLTPNRSPAEPPPRRFHTVHDAAVWIQHNWPDFDLEATHPVVWRGEM